MKISWLRAANDTESFKFFKNMGLDVFEVQDLDKTDEKIKELVNNKYETIILSDAIAANSADIIRKYKKDDYINIVIASRQK